MALVATLSPYEAAFELRTQYGFCVIPLRTPGVDGKKPALGFEWARWQTELPDEDLLDVWNERYPGANWAVVCGKVSDLVVVDCDDETAITWVREHLPRTPWTVKTGKGEHFYYKYPADREKWVNGLNFKTQLGLRIDCQRDGKYVVAPCSVHESGKLYTANFNEPWDYVPEFDVFDGPKGAENMADALADLDMSGVKATHAPVGEGFRHNLITSRVGILVNQGYDPDQAKAAARKINSELCNPPLPIKEVHAIVNGIFKKDRAARQDLPPLPSMNPEDEPNIEIDDSDPLTETEWPEEALHPGGTLEKIMDYTEAAAVRTERVYALAGAIVTMGAILGQRLRTETDLVTNMYCVVLGPSASGKDAPKRITIRLLEAVDPNLFAGSDVSSEVAIYVYLRDWHRACFVFDEIGMFLKGAKRQNSPKFNVVKALTELSSGDHMSRSKKAYSSQDLLVNISWYSISMLGLSVPSEYYESMQSGETVNGWLARNLVFEVNAPLKEKKSRVNSEIPEGLLAELRALWAIDGGEGKVVAGHDGSVSTEPGPANPSVVCMTPEAEAFHVENDHRMEALAREAFLAGRIAENSVRGRAAEHARRLALIHAASRLGPAVVNGHIELVDVRWAWAVVITAIDRLCARLLETIYESDFDAVKQKIRAAIHLYIRRDLSRGHARKPGAPESFIYRHLKSVPPDIIEKAMKSMHRANELRLRKKVKTSDKSTRAMDLYCLVKEKEEE